MCFLSELKKDSLRGPLHPCMGMTQQTLQLVLDYMQDSRALYNQFVTQIKPIIDAYKYSKWLEVYVTNSSASSVTIEKLIEMPSSNLVCQI